MLVIEDQPLLRMMAVDLVEEAGFTALEASGAAEAIRILEGRDDVRLVFSDIVLGKGLDGMRLAALIRDRWPPIDFIITSGMQHPGAGQMPTRGIFFEQPYRRSEVAAAMHRMMD